MRHALHVERHIVGRLFVVVLLGEVGHDFFVDGLPVRFRLKRHERKPDGFIRFRLSHFSKGERHILRLSNIEYAFFVIERTEFHPGV